MQLKDNIYKLFLESEGVCTDSRQIKKILSFSVLKAETLMEIFLHQALSQGCCHFCVIDDKKYKKGSTFQLTMF